MRILLYTCNIGNYDSKPVHNLVPKIEYKELTSCNIDISNAQASRFYKIHCPYQDNWDISVYADSNMNLVYPNELINLCWDLSNSEESAIFFAHPQRTTCHQEILECIKQGKGNGLLNEYNKYRKEGFPDNVQLTENNVIIRKLGSQHLDLRICEGEWYSAFANGCHRDQVCLPYAKWKSNYTNFKILPQSIKENIFKWRPHL